MLAKSLVLLATASALQATAVPLELSYTGQVTDAAGNPVATLDADAPASHIGGLRVTFWSGAWNGGAAPQTPPGTKRNVTLLAAVGGAGLTVAGTYVTSCTPGGSFALPNCQAVGLNTGGVFQINLYLSQAHFDTVFPTGSSSYIQIERVYVNINTGAVTSVHFFPRQRFTATPYALKVPIDGATMAYSGGALTIANGGITAAKIAAGSEGQVLTTSGGVAAWRNGSSGSGAVLKMAVNPVVGNSAWTSLSYAPSNGNVSFTPVSTNSSLLVECSFGAQLLAPATTAQAQAGYQLMDTTSGALLGSTVGFKGMDGAGKNLTVMQTPATVRAKVPNYSTSPRSFALCQSVTPGSTVYVYNPICSVTEIAN